MNSLTKRQKEIGLFVLAIIFLLALATYSYFNVYAPAKQLKEQATQTLANERDILFALQRQEARQSQGGLSSSRRLQEKVPVKPLEDLILLQVLKAEVKSDVRVHEVSFSLEPIGIENPPEQVENVQAVITDVRVVANTYSQIDQFIEEIESMERIFIIDRIGFTAPEEVTSFEQENEIIELTVTFKAFYRSHLGNLEDEAPKVNAPESSRKLDPTPVNQLPQMGDRE
ncbi:pilus assembly protein PilO [Sporosarcina sp. UB5]|uniref:pilus assembly protein PilO n=1 Tax=Sporosarcina sp. UB5 TaxID=3047463 RepID=UPI003D7ABA47